MSEAHGVTLPLGLLRQQALALCALLGLLISNGILTV